MRLLDFDSADSGAKPHAATVRQKAAKKPAKNSSPAIHATTAKSTTEQVPPVNVRHAVRQPVRRNPIDLEQLQQRIEVVEHRLRARARNSTNQLPAKELEQLKQRLKLLERSVHNELWAAKQREHTLLEMLARPPLVKLLRDRVKRLSTHTLPTTFRWCRAVGCEWWDDYQPYWWPRFARAWQESLDKARGISPD